MDFGAAMRWMRKGERVYRKDFPGPDSYVALDIAADGETVEVVCHYAGDRRIYQPTADDFLADDWHVRFRQFAREDAQIAPVTSVSTVMPA